jgi:phenylalanyl-tRNA synthetase beta chain
MAPLGSTPDGGAGAEEPVLLDNPVSELYSTLRRSLLPGLVAGARYNTRRGAESVRLFELGVAFGRRADRMGGVEGVAGVVEREAVGVVCGGAVGTPWERRQELDLFDLKGAVEALADAAGVAVEARPPEESAGILGLLPGASAELWAGGRRAGVLGRLAGGDDPFPLYVAELELAALEANPAALRAARQVEPPPRLPGIEADLTLTHPTAVPWAEIAAAIRREAAPELRDFRLKVRYTGEGVPEGAVNTTVTFLYHGGERQLTQEEVNERQGALAAALVERFGRPGAPTEVRS